MDTLANVGATSNSLWWALNGVSLLFACSNCGITVRESPYTDMNLLYAVLYDSGKIDPATGWVRSLKCLKRGNQKIYFSFKNPGRTSNIECVYIRTYICTHTCEAADINLRTNVTVARSRFMLVRVAAASRKLAIQLSRYFILCRERGLELIVVGTSGRNRLLDQYFVTGLLCWFVSNY